MRALGRRNLLGLAAAAWLVAGPGGLLLREALACDAETMSPAHASHSHHKAPSGPCFCSQMTGGFDQAVSVAAPALVSTAMSVAPVELWQYASPFSLPQSPTLAPEPPVPIPS